MCNIRSLCTGIITLLFSCGTAWAIGGNIESNYLFVTVFPDNLNGSGTSRLRSIIFDSAVLELGHLGFPIYPLASDNDAISEPDDLESAFEFARKEYVPSLISITYAINDNLAILKMDMYDVDDESEKAAVTLETKIDLFLDAAIAESVRRLVEKSGITPPAISEEPVMNSGTGSLDITSGNEEQTVDLLPGGNAEFSDPIEAKTPSGENSRRFFILSTGFAPFIAVGKAVSFFSIGLEPNLLFAFVLPPPLDFLQTGLLLKATQFTAQGVLVETENYLLSGGPDVRLFISPSSAVSVYFHAAGGPTAFILRSETIGNRWKLIPFVSAGVGVSLAFNDVFGLIINVDYSVYFERSIFIMGVSPSANASLRL